jgi:hypothetical protein
MRRSYALLAAAMSVTVVPEAQAQATPESAVNAPLDQAREHFLRGVELYREGNYRAAIIEFERAYSIAPNYKVLFNIGQAYLELQDYAAALTAFERFSSEGGADLTEQQKSDVEAEIKKLAGRIAKVELTVNVPSATISVDDVTVGRSPLTKPLTLSTGRHKIVVAREGFLPETRMVDLAGGDARKLEVVLKEVAAPKATEPAPVTPQAPQPETGMGTPFWVGLGLTGVFAVGSGVTGYLALSAKNDNDDQAKTLGTTRSDLQDSQKRMDNFALATDILLGATVLAGGLTIYFAAEGPSEPSTQVGLAPGGAVVAGTF